MSTAASKTASPKSKSKVGGMKTKAASPKHIETPKSHPKSSEKSAEKSPASKPKAAGSSSVGSKHTSPKAKTEGHAGKAKSHATSPVKDAGSVAAGEDGAGGPAAAAEGSAGGVGVKDSGKVSKIQSLYRGRLERKTKHVICYNCGGPFDVCKIADHQSDGKCTQVIEKLRAELPERLRGIQAVKPADGIPAADAAAEVITAYNKVAKEAYQASLPTCPCGKRLELELMKIHSTKCEEWKK